MPSVTRVVKFIKKGEKGDAGRSVLLVDVEYAISESNTTAPTDGWSTDPPTWEDGKYIWSRTRVEYSEGDPEYTDPVCITGGTGATGNGVVDIVEEYYRSTSAYSLTGGSWSTSRWTWINGRYIWTRSHITLTDRDYYTTAICITGARGTAATQYYTWIKYADDASGNGMSDDPVTTDSDGNTVFKKYIGFAYNKTSKTESTNASDYTWALFKGTDGTNGIDGIDGTTLYTWIKYADYLGDDGYPTTMYDTPTAQTKYIGIAANQTSKTEGTEPSLYSWSKFRGDDGTSFTAKGTAESHFNSSTEFWASSYEKGKTYLYDDSNGAAVVIPYERGSSIIVPTDGDAYTTSDKHLWVKNGASWIDLGEIQGPQGPQGPQGEQGGQGDPGITFDIVPSVAHLSADANGTITTSYIALEGYKNQGGKRTSLGLAAAKIADAAYYYAQYKVDSGSWTDCGTISIGTGVYLLAGYGVALASYKSATSGIAFRLLKSDDTSNVLAETPQLKIVKDGAKGEVGPALRGPQDWESLDEGYQFYQGALGEPYKDVVYFNGQYYSCTKSHTKSADRADVEENSSGVESLKTDYWTLGDKVELVATKILLAAYAVIKNLGVQNVVIGGSGYNPDSENGEIVMLDSSNNILFQVKDGKVVANIGTFNNINVQSGTIAGFKISGNGLTNDPFTNDAYVIFRNDTVNCFAGIGGNVLPTSSGLRAVARFENEDTTNQWGFKKNIALYLSAKNGEIGNFAFCGQGNGILNGWIGGFKFYKIALSANNTIYDGETIVNMYEANCFIVNSTASGAGVALPKLSHVCKALGISSGTNFCVEITIMSDLGSNGFTIYGRNKKKSSSGTYPWNTEQLPLFTHWNGGKWEYLDMGEGDSVTIMLVYDSSRTATIDGFSTKYTARTINRQD